VTSNETNNQEQLKKESEKQGKAKKMFFSQ
jgi:hypothetical protein